MPSLEQLRWEAFADAVESAAHSPLLVTFAHDARENVDVRLETAEGATIDCRLLRVDLDGRALIGSIPRGGGLCIPLERVRAVWHKRRRTGRVLLVSVATILAGAAGGAVGAVVTGWGRAGDGGIIGALLGSIASIGVLLLCDKWSALHQWIPMYDGTQPS